MKRGIKKLIEVKITRKAVSLRQDNREEYLPELVTVKVPFSAGRSAARNKR